MIRALMAVWRTFGLLSLLGGLGACGDPNIRNPFDSATLTDSLPGSSSSDESASATAVPTTGISASASASGLDSTTTDGTTETDDATTDPGSTSTSVTGSTTDKTTTDGTSSSDGTSTGTTTEGTTTEGTTTEGTTTEGTTTSGTTTSGTTDMTSTTGACNHPAGTYGDCLGMGNGVCMNLSATCLQDDVNMPTVGACSLTDCVDECDCPAAPVTGDAPVTCGDILSGGGFACYLDCSQGQTCPNGMVCFANFICMWQQ